MGAADDVPADLRATAARALASGDALLALKLVGPFGGPHALAIRGIALAQMGEYAEARGALARAEGAFAAAGEERARARASAALAEVALAQRDLGAARRGLLEAGDALEAAGDRGNAIWARLAAARAALLEGRVAEAERALASAEAAAAGGATAVTRAALALARAESHARLLRADPARRAAEEAAAWARRSGHPRLVEETERFLRAHDEPVARVVRGGAERPARLADVEALLAERGVVVVDELRRRVVAGGEARADLAHRPVLFAAIAALGRAHPAAVDSADLARAAFGVRAVNESHLRRLRVEIGRLRAAIDGTGALRALRNAWRWDLGPGVEVAVLAPLEPGDAGAVRALLSDGAAWSAQAIAAALGKSARTAQRALAGLVLAGEVEAAGAGPARRYARTARAPAIASQMLLLGLALPG